MKNYEDYKMNRHQEKFVILANENGFKNKISRKEIVALEAKYGIKKPEWLKPSLIRQYLHLSGRAVYGIPVY